MASGRPKMYGELAGWFHLLTPPAHYEDEADLYRRTLAERAERPVREVLELGSGGGNNASHMKAHFTMMLTDLSEDMLAISRGLNPECEHVLGDMRTLRLDRGFDAVFAHDAASYLTTREDLRAAVETAASHLRPGGVALFVPDHVRETFRPSTDHGGSDGEDRAFRYLEWTWDPDPDDDVYLADFAFLIREGYEVRVEHDRHVCGAFPRDVWLAAIEDAGLLAHHLAMEEMEAAEAEAFVGVKPGG